MTGNFDKLVQEFLALEQPAPAAPPVAPPKPAPTPVTPVPSPGPSEKPRHPLQPKPGRKPKPKAGKRQRNPDVQAFIDKRVNGI